MTRVLWLPESSRGSWDQNILEELTSGDDFDVKQNPRNGAVIVIAGQHLVGDADWLCDSICGLPWALTIVTSDEEALFPVDLLPRDERHAVWTEYHDRGMDRVIPIGPQPGTAQKLAAMPIEAVVGEPARELSVSFAGQNTHERRAELIDVMKDLALEKHPNILWVATTGFRQGLGQDEYLGMLARTKLAPCPSGPHSLDSFRLYEALAAGALPIIETHTPHGDERGFWRALFGEGCPIPQVDSWHEFPALVEHVASDPVAWRERRDEVQEWWRLWREDFRRDFYMTVERLRG